jgi:glucosyl-dolichyl phosphate glucuronosyltransferase
MRPVKDARCHRASQNGVDRGVLTSLVSNMICSIIIATFNRARALERTLRHFSNLSVPADWKVELIIADNASTDDTPAVARNANSTNIEVRYLYEGRKGKSNALNTSLAQARGEIILFTDDDVAPTQNWFESIGGPLLDRSCDGVVGRIELSKEVCRPWMTDTQKAGLASFDGPGQGPLLFVGANMGIHRSVLERVPAFDPELGPGASGLWEDSLFSMQLAEAKCRLRYLPDAAVVHCPDPSRLQRQHCLSSGRMYGAGMAYVLYHWQHEQLPFPRLRWCYIGLKLRLRRLLEPPGAPEEEGIAPWELSYVGEMEKCRQYLIQQKRPRTYSRRGLRKLSQ